MAITLLAMNYLGFGSIKMLECVLLIIPHIYLTGVQRTIGGRRKTPVTKAKARDKPPFLPTAGDSFTWNGLRIGLPSYWVKYHDLRDYFIKYLAGAIPDQSSGGRPLKWNYIESDQMHHTSKTEIKWSKKASEPKGLKELRWGDSQAQLIVESDFVDGDDEKAELVTLTNNAEIRQFWNVQSGGLLSFDKDYMYISMKNGNCVPNGIHFMASLMNKTINVDKLIAEDVNGISEAKFFQWCDNYGIPAFSLTETSLIFVPITDDGDMHCLVRVPFNDVELFFNQDLSAREKRKPKKSKGLKKSQFGPKKFPQAALRHNLPKLQQLQEQVDELREAMQAKRGDGVKYLRDQFDRVCKHHNSGDGNYCDHSFKEYAPAWWVARQYQEGNADKLEKRFTISSMINKGKALLEKIGNGMSACHSCRYEMYRTAPSVMSRYCPKELFDVRKVEVTKFIGGMRVKPSGKLGDMGKKILRRLCANHGTREELEEWLDSPTSNSFHAGSRTIVNVLTAENLYNNGTKYHHFQSKYCYINRLAKMDTKPITHIHYRYPITEGDRSYLARNPRDYVITSETDDLWASFLRDFKTNYDPNVNNLIMMVDCHYYMDPVQCSRVNAFLDENSMDRVTFVLIGLEFPREAGIYDLIDGEGKVSVNEGQIVMYTNGNGENYVHNNVRVDRDIMDCTKSQPLTEFMNYGNHDRVSAPTVGVFYGRRLGVQLIESEGLYLPRSLMLESDSFHTQNAERDLKNRYLLKNNVMYNPWIYKFAAQFSTFEWTWRLLCHGVAWAIGEEMSSFGVYLSPVFRSASRVSGLIDSLAFYVDRGFTTCEAFIDALEEGVCCGLGISKNVCEATLVLYGLTKFVLHFRFRLWLFVGFSALAFWCGLWIFYLNTVVLSIVGLLMHAWIIVVVIWCVCNRRVRRVVVMLACLYAITGSTKYICGYFKLKPIRELRKPEINPLVNAKVSLTLRGEKVSWGAMVQDLVQNPEKVETKREPTLSGYDVVDGGSSFEWYYNSFGNFMHTLTERLLKPQTGVNLSLLEEWRQFNRKDYARLKQNLHEIKNDLPSDWPVNLIMSKVWAPSKKKMYLDQIQRDAEDVRSGFWYSCFLKKGEAQRSNAVSEGDYQEDSSRARMITAVEGGFRGIPFLVANLMNDLLSRSFQSYSYRMNVDKYRGKLNRRTDLQNFVSADCSALDSTLYPEVKDHVELDLLRFLEDDLRLILSRWFPTGSIDRAFVQMYSHKKWFSYARGERKCTVRLSGLRASGDPFTTCWNTYTVDSAVRFALSRAGVPANRYKNYTSGDDILVQCSALWQKNIRAALRCVFNKSWDDNEKKLGLIIKDSDLRCGKTGSFLSMWWQFCDNQITIIRDPMNFICNSRYWEMRDRSTLENCKQHSFVVAQSLAQQCGDSVLYGMIAEARFRMGEVKVIDDVEMLRRFGDKGSFSAVRNMDRLILYVLEAVYGVKNPLDVFSQIGECRKVGDAVYLQRSINGRRKINMNDRNIRKAIANFINPFESEPIKVPFPGAQHSSIFKRIGSAALSPDASGNLAFRLSMDPDSDTTLGIDATTPSTNVGSNVYASAITIAQKASTKVWPVACAVRFKYIGPVLNRSGIMYAQADDRNTMTVDTTTAVWHPFGHVIPVTDEWIYVRQQFITTGYNSSEHQDHMNHNVYGYFTGLPNISGCIYAELVVINEFIPIDTEYLFVGTSSTDRLSVDEYNLFSTVIREPKLQSNLHGHESKFLQLEDGNMRVSGITKHDLSNFFKKYVVPFLKFGAKKALQAYAPEVIPFINHIDSRLINGKNEERLVKRKTNGIKTQLDQLSSILSKMSLDARGGKQLKSKKNPQRKGKKKFASVKYALKS